MNERQPIVFIVDDDKTSRRFFEAVLSDAQIATCSVESASAFLQMHDALVALAAGADDYLIKDAEPDVS